MDRHKLDDSQISLYTRIAYYYYIEGMTQERIAKCLNLSRQLVNRILRACLEYEIVKISIQNLDKSNLELENRIKKKFGLLDIRVVDNVKEENFFKDIGVAAGEYLSSVIADGEIIGLTRGRTLSALAEYMPPIAKKNLTVVQLLGSRDHKEQHTAINQIVHNFSNKLNARQVLLFAPIAVQSAELKRRIYEETAFIDAYKSIQSCTMVVTGIGTGESLDIMAKQMGTQGSKLIELSGNQILTAEVATYFIDQHGKDIPSLYRNRIIAAALDDFLKIPVRIGIAGLPVKAKAIHAALLGKYINILIIDKNTAKILDGF
jgi:DNA-binding transcriptional regulator LsrR (DeoR family)